MKRSVKIMANAWFRMYSEFATDPKVQMMSESNQRRLTMLMCVRCNGDVTLHDDEIAFQLRVTDEEWSDTKTLFINKGFIDKDNNLLNWDKRQYVSDSSTARVAKHRNKKKQQCNVTVTPPEQIQNRTDTDIKERKPRVTFAKPSESEVSLFASENNLNLTGFYDYYESNGWRVGKNKMKDWNAAARGWHKRQQEFDKGAGNAANSRAFKPKTQSAAIAQRITQDYLASGGRDFSKDDGHVRDRVDEPVSDGDFIELSQERVG